MQQQLSLQTMQQHLNAQQLHLHLDAVKYIKPSTTPDRKHAASGQGFPNSASPNSLQQRCSAKAHMQRAAPEPKHTQLAVMLFWQT